MATITKDHFGRRDGQDVFLYSLTCDGDTARISDYGGLLTSWTAPDRSGRRVDIALGFDGLASYTSDSYLKAGPYLGAVIGRYCNRIGGAKFRLDGVEYELAANNGPNNLHGGLKGFDKRVWNAGHEVRGEDCVLTLEYTSADGEEGFPGKLETTVVYTFSPGNVLTVDYTATTDKPTVVNLTHHAYFNLAGEGNGDILGTEVQVNAWRFTPIDENTIPTGELRDVTGTPFDFRQPVALGARINEPDEQLKLGFGYDHNWIIDRGANTGLVLAASAFEPGSGRLLEVLTTEPGVQLYCGNHLDGSLTGKSGKKYVRRGGFCLETQHYPDSPNKPGFPSTRLAPGQIYHTTTVFKLSVR